VAVSNVELKVDGRSATRELNRVNAAVGKLQGAVGGLVAGFTAVQTFKFVFAKTAELETQTKSLKVLTGSLENAKSIIKELQDFGAVTPFTSAELIETSKRLKAFGVETSKLVDTTKRLGDIAGATGADLSGIATAYGQIQAKGKLQTEELLQLQERGVDLAGVLKKEYGLTGEEFSKALQKGQISAEAAEFALKKLTDAGGQYADGAIAQSDTLSGKFSTLQDNIDQLARTIGQVLSPVIKGVFDQAIQALGAINQLLASGRAGAFNRKIGGISSAITFGLTSQAVDDIEKFLGQISSQKNKAGIQQNIQALTQLSNVLQRIGAEDPNAGRAVALQGRIMKMQSQNLQALKDLPKNQLKEITLPSLTPSNATSRASKAAKERVDMSEAMFTLEQKRQSLAFSNNELLKIELDRQIEVQRIMESNMLPRERTIALQESTNQALKRGAQVLKPMIEGVAELQQGAKDAGTAFAELFIKADNKKLAEQAAKMDQLYRSIGDSIQTGIVDSLTAAVEGTKSLAEVASDTLRSLANIMLKFGLQTFLGGLGGDDGVGFFSKLFGGGRASGGTVKGGTSYLVGERGPELFTPGRSGSIAPNNSMGGANVTVNVDASGSRAQGDNANASQLGKAIGAAVQAELIKQQRPGGLLAR
jgi:tape measure domain-containing protein